MFLASYSWRMCQSMFIRRPLWWFWCTALFHWKETTNFLLLQSLSRCFILLSSVWMFKESTPPPTISKNGEADISVGEIWHGFVEADWEDVTLEIVDAKNISKRPTSKAGHDCGGKPKSCVFRWEKVQDGRATKLIYQIILIFAWIWIMWIYDFDWCVFLKGSLDLTLGVCLTYLWFCLRL